MLTTIEIAKELNISEHAVRRYVKKAGIQPVRWVGYTRLFDKSAMNKIMSIRKSCGRPRKEKL